MTLADIQRTFGDKVQTRFVADHSTKRTIPTAAIVLESFADGGELWIDTSTFLRLFGSLELTHASLTTSPLAGTTSWGKHFQDWKAQGLIT